MPDSIEVVLIDQPNDAPWGAGEPVTEIMPGSIGNAIFDAISVRLRTVPFTPDAVLAALATAWSIIARDRWARGRGLAARAPCPRDDRHRHAVTATNPRAASVRQPQGQPMRQRQPGP